MQHEDPDRQRGPCHRARRPIFTQALTAGPNDVVVGGKSIGQAPDANVRLQMRRDAGSEGGF